MDKTKIRPDKRPSPIGVHFLYRMRKIAIYHIELARHAAAVQDVKDRCGDDVDAEALVGKPVVPYSPIELECARRIYELVHPVQSLDNDMICARLEFEVCAQEWQSFMDDVSTKEKDFRIDKPAMELDNAIKACKDGWLSTVGKLRELEKKALAGDGSAAKDMKTLLGTDDPSRKQLDEAIAMFESSLETRSDFLKARYKEMKEQVNLRMMSVDKSFLGECAINERYARYEMDFVLIAGLYAMAEIAEKKESNYPFFHPMVDSLKTLAQQAMTSKRPEKLAAGLVELAAYALSGREFDDKLNRGCADLLMEIGAFIERNSFPCESELERRRNIGKANIRKDNDSEKLKALLEAEWEVQKKRNKYLTKGKFCERYLNEHRNEPLLGNILSSKTLQNLFSNNTLRSNAKRAHDNNFDPDDLVEEKDAKWFLANLSGTKVARGKNS